MDINGKRLLELCKTTQLLIANGRLGHDTGLGEYTSIGSNGRCVVDYLLLSRDYFDNVVNFQIPGHVAQSVTCLATDASLTANPGVASSIPARSHTFVEIDHEIISTVILLPSAESFKKGCCQLQAKVCARSTG